MGDNVKEKSIIVISKKSNIFYKLKEFIKQIFNKKSNLNTNQSHNTLIENAEDINVDKELFKKSLKLDVHLIELQNKLKLGQITIKDLTREEKKDMINLYQKQIIEKKNKLKNLNQKILFYKKTVKE